MSVRHSITATTSNIVIWSCSLGSDYAITVDFWGTGFNTANGSGSYHYANNFKQVSSVVANVGTFYTDKKESAAPYAGKLALTFTSSWTILEMLASNTAAFGEYD